MNDICDLVFVDDKKVTWNNVLCYQMTFLVEGPTSLPQKPANIVKSAMTANNLEELLQVDYEGYFRRHATTSDIVVEKLTLKEKALAVQYGGWNEHGLAFLMKFIKFFGLKKVFPITSQNAAKTATLLEEYEEENGLGYCGDCAGRSHRD